MSPAERPLLLHDRITPGRKPVIAIIRLGMGPLLLTAEDLQLFLEGLKGDHSSTFTLKLVQRSQSMDEPLSMLEIDHDKNGDIGLLLWSVVWRSDMEGDGDNDRHLIDRVTWLAASIPALEAYLRALIEIERT